MPVGDIPGWHEVFAEDFNGPTLDLRRWRRYSGQPAGDPAGWWDPRHVSVSNGMLVISGYRDPRDPRPWATGGVSTGPSLDRTYGKFLVRFRFDSGIGIAHAILLWPARGTSSDEIDFSEDDAGRRIRTHATVHYGRDNSMIGKWKRVNLTEWHTVGVEWLKHIVRFTLDGQVWFVIRGKSVPAVPMALAIQTQSWPCVAKWGRCPNSTTPRVVNLDVDWVVAYAPKRR